MNFLHKSVSNLPIIIVIDWLICALFFTRNKFYIENFEILDRIDTYVVYFSLMHFLFFNKWYSQTKKNFSIVIILSIILRLLSDYLNTELYFYLYLSIILAPFTVSLWKQSMKK